MRETIRLTGHLTEESLAPQIRDELLQIFRDWKMESNPIAQHGHRDYNQWRFRVSVHSSMRQSMQDLISTIDEWQARGDKVALATVVKTGGSTPRPIGAKMIVNSRGEFAGSVSGGCVEGAVIDEARRVIKTGQPKLLKYGIADETAWDVGLSCGGMIEVFVEVVQ
jgi:hypothetical protein